MLKDMALMKMSIALNAPMVVPRKQVSVVMAEVAEDNEVSEVAEEQTVKEIRDTPRLEELGAKLDGIVARMAAMENRNDARLKEIERSLASLVTVFSATDLSEKDGWLTIHS